MLKCGSQNEIEKPAKQFITFRKISNQFEQKQFFSFFSWLAKNIIILEKDEG
jgi:hypothetical protein